MKQWYTKEVKTTSQEAATVVNSMPGIGPDAFIRSLEAKMMHPIDYWLEQIGTAKPN